MSPIIGLVFSASRGRNKALQRGDGSVNMGGPADRAEENPFPGRRRGRGLLAPLLSLRGMLELWRA